MALPRMTRIRQHFPRPVVPDVAQAVKEQIDQLALSSRVHPGDSVAITAGSRGVANIATIIRATAEAMKELGLKPFVIPTMGSHGGATPEGQRAVLEHYGITEETVGVPVRATMAVQQLGNTADGLPVFLDWYASEADHIIVVNRIKRHTDFGGRIESGMMKMMAIGLGKQHGANQYHRAFFRFGFEHVISTVGQFVLKNAPVLCGIGLVENGYEETAKVAACLPEELEKTEEKLLAESKQIVAELPVEEIDLLIVDWMGKDISGTGVDTNVIGRMMQNFEAEPETPRILRILVCDITPDSGGNAVGVGLVDFTTQRLVDKYDRHATYMNCITALGPQKARIPVYYDTDRESIENALETVGLTPPEEARVVRIHSTLHLIDVEVSEVLLPELQDRDDIEILGDPQEMAFDEQQNLVPIL